jgi:hypothetical protein
MRYILISLLALLGTGCGGFGPISYRTASFLGVNELPYAVNLTVQTVGPMGLPGGGRPVPFEVEIPVPKNERPAGYYGTVTGPDLDFKTVYIKVIVHDPVRQTTTSQECSASPSTVTYIQYKAGGGSPYIYCGGSRG